jgi:hypothetical protein
LDSVRIILAEVSQQSVEILFPKSGTSFALDGTLRAEVQRLFFLPARRLPPRKFSGNSTAK